MLNSFQQWDLIALVGCLAAVAFFSGFLFPRQLAADGEARPPRRWVSMVLFVGLNFIVFLSLAGATLIFQNCDEARDALEKIFNATSNEETTDKTLEAFKALASSIFLSLSEGSQTPAVASVADGLIGGLVAYYAFFAFRKGRVIAAGAMRQLHSVNLIEEDVQELDQRLRQGEFARLDEDGDPTSRNLYQLQRRVSDADADNPRTSLAMKYEKLEALLGLWSSRKDWALTLPRSGQIDLDELKNAAARRKALAVDINNHVQRLENGDGDPELLNDIIDRLNRHEREAENVVDEIRGMVQQAGGTSVAQLRVILAPIVKYLNDEYDISLKAITQATAQSVVMSGDEAGKRLKWLDEAGFKGLGKFDPINPHVALGIMLAIFAALMIIMTVYNFLRGTGALNIPVLAAFSGGLTCAVIVGVMVGGLRDLARRKSPPWGWYLLAASAAVVLYVLLVFFADAAVTRTEQSQRLTRLLLLGWGLPFSIVLVTCWLARQEVWRPLRIPTRCSDGLLLAAILAAVTILTVMVAYQRGHFGKTETEPTPLERYTQYPALLAVIGFIIGVSVIHRVRQAARSHVVAPDAQAGRE